MGGHVKGVHETSSERSLEVPADTVIAFQVVELSVDSDGEFYYNQITGKTV